MERNPENPFDDSQELNSSENRTTNNNEQGGDNNESGNNYQKPYYNKPYQQQKPYYNKPYNNNEGGGYDNKTYYKKRTDGDGNQEGGNNYQKPYYNNNRGGGNYNNNYGSNGGGYKKPYNNYGNNNEGGGNYDNKTYYKKRTEGDGNQENSGSYDNKTYYKKRTEDDSNQGGGYDNKTYYKKRTEGDSNQGGGNNYQRPYNNNRGGGSYGNNNNNYGGNSGGYKKPYQQREGGGGYENRGGGGYNRGGGGYNKFPHKRPYQQEEEVYVPSKPVYTMMPILPNEREDAEGMRINKYIAHAGVCARRKADDYIKAGRVTVNGIVMDQVGYRVKKSDLVVVDGKDVKPAKKYVYILLNKPRNVITTADDEKGRKTVLDLVKELTEERVYPVGRLDRDTTGLVLLTNDGELAQRLAHPSHEIKKIYQVILDKPMQREDLDKIRETVTLEDGPAPVDRVEYVEGKDEQVVGIELHSGRNRIVRRIFEHLGYRVLRLDRVKYAMLTKKGLPRGACRFLNRYEITMLKHLF